MIDEEGEVQRDLRWWNYAVVLTSEVRSKIRKDGNSSNAKHFT